jgi:hypothetical protein
VKGGGKKYEICNRCGKKGVYWANGWRVGDTVFNQGEQCKYCHTKDPNAHYDGMLLTDAEADSLPEWLTDENCHLELVSSEGVPTPEHDPTHVWRLHIRHG